MKLKIGILGLSKGNGHPYSWSAIFNGFNSSINCPFDVIPKYLSNEKYPENFLGHLATVTHIWTQDYKTSKEVASFAYITNIVDNPVEMIGHVDAILLARDDANNHYEMAKPFIEKNIPIFIDKPLSFNLKDANKILNLKTSKNQLIYSCSSIRFAKEFNFKFINNEYNLVEAQIMKDWEKYAIHIIEPVIKMFPNRGKLLNINNVLSENNINIVNVKWTNLTAIFKVLGNNKTPIKISLYGKNNFKELVFEDTFYAFKHSLKYFIELVKGEQLNILETETLEIIKIIEKGNIV